MPAKVTWRTARLLSYPRVLRAKPQVLAQTAHAHAQRCIYAWTVKKANAEH